MGERLERAPSHDDSRCTGDGEGHGALFVFPDFDDEDDDFQEPRQPEPIVPIAPAAV